MKTLTTALVLLVFAIAAAPALESPAKDAADLQLLNLVREVQAQQALMAENQAKLEASLATIAESVRVSRIYSSRSGN